MKKGILFVVFSSIVIGLVFLNVSSTYKEMTYEINDDLIFEVNEILQAEDINKIVKISLDGEDIDLSKLNEVAYPVIDSDTTTIVLNPQEKEAYLSMSPDDRSAYIWNHFGREKARTAILNFSVGNTIGRRVEFITFHYHVLEKTHD